MFKVSFAMYSQVKLFVFSAMCCKSYRLITTFHDVEAFSNFYSHGSWLPAVLRFSILRGKWDKNPVTTHTTNATLNSYSRAD